MWGSETKIQAIRHNIGVDSTLRPQWTGVLCIYAYAHILTASSEEGAHLLSSFLPGAVEVGGKFTILI